MGGDGGGAAGSTADGAGRDTAAGAGRRGGTGGDAAGGTGGGNGFHQIHLTDDLGHGIAAHRFAIAGDWIAELLHAKQTLGLIGRTFAAQNRLPEVFDQGQTLLQ